MTAEATRTSLDSLDVEALTVAMALAPGVYSRNRLYPLFEASPAKAARRRAATLRGLARHLAAHTTRRLDVELVATPRHDGGWTLTYRVAQLRLTRTLDVTDVERAVVAELASTAEAPCTLLPTTPRDRAMIDAALHRLAPALPRP